jgi:hypothetical protein
MKEIIIPILAGIGVIFSVCVFFFYAAYRIWKWSDEEKHDSKGYFHDANRHLRK